MDRISFSTTQARHRHCCPRCGHKQRPVRSHGSYLRGFLRMIYRDRNKHPGLHDDAMGRTFLMILLSLGLPIEDVDDLASWVTLKELRAIKQAARRFDPNGFNISKAIAFTDAERKYYGEKYNLFSIMSSESDWSVEYEKRIKANKEKRNERRREAKAALIAACGDVHEVAVMKALIRIRRRPGAYVWLNASVKNIVGIIGTIASDDFPEGSDARRVAVHHALDRLERRRLVETEVRLQGRLRVRCATLIPRTTVKSVRTPYLAKTSSDQRVKSGRAVAHTQVIGLCHHEDPTNTTVPASRRDRKGAFQGGIPCSVPVSPLAPSSLHEGLQVWKA